MAGSTLREVFERVGPFDDALERNQDNEFNARVSTAGFTIFFDPRLSTTYVMKTDPAKFLRRGFTLGSYHPRTWRTNWRSFRLRHALPSLWVLYLAVATVGLTLGRWSWPTVIPAMASLFVLLCGAITIARRQTFRVALAAIPVFAGFHMAHGAGTILGIRRLINTSPKSATRA